eukprot:jgi/Pico_ML_1/55655/g1314.t1
MQFGHAGLSEKVHEHLVNIDPHVFFPFSHPLEHGARQALVEVAQLVRHGLHEGGEQFGRRSSDLPAGIFVVAVFVLFLVFFRFFGERILAACSFFAFHLLLVQLAIVLVIGIVLDVFESDGQDFVQQRGEDVSDVRSHPFAVVADECTGHVEVDRASLPSQLGRGSALHGCFLDHVQHVQAHVWIVLDAFQRLLQQLGSRLDRRLGTWTGFDVRQHGFGAHRGLLSCIVSAPFAILLVPFRADACDECVHQPS